MGTPPPPPDRTAAVVTAIWAAMSAAAVGFVLAFGVNFPFTDEWATLDILAAPRPDPGWLWERHNEHLLPLPRLAYWAAFRLTGDLRAGMLLSALGWSLLAKLLIDTARAVRGRAAYADAFFPVVLLNWSQYENLLMSYQVAFMASTVLAGLTLRELALGGATTGRLLRVGLYAALLPMCGGPGLVLAGPGVVWLLAAGVATRRVALCGTLAAVAVASMSQYWWAAPPAAPGWQPPLTGKTIAVGLLGFGSAGYGLAGWHLWPWLGVVPTAVVVVTGWATGRAWWQSRSRFSGPLPPWGGGLGWGVAATPHPNPPPQGGRGQEQTGLYRADGVRRRGVRPGRRRRLGPRPVRGVRRLLPAVHGAFRPAAGGRVLPVVEVRRPTARPVGAGGPRRGGRRAVAVEHIARVGRRAAGVRGAAGGRRRTCGPGCRSR